MYLIYIGGIMTLQKAQYQEWVICYGVVGK